MNDAKTESLSAHCERVAHALLDRAAMSGQEQHIALAAGILIDKYLMLVKDGR